MRLLRRALTKIPRDRDLLQGRRQGALAFVHIPKTAGTWFSSFLMQHFTEAEIAPTHHTAPESMDFDDAPKRFFCGHFRFLAIETERPLRFVTFLRDPFKRTESYYRSWREHGDPLVAGDNRALAEAVMWTREATYEQFVCSDNPIIESSIRNVQTAYVSSVPSHNDPSFLVWGFSGQGVFSGVILFLASFFFFRTAFVIVIRGEPALRAPGARDLVFG